MNSGFSDDDLAAHLDNYFESGAAREDREAMMQKGDIEQEQYVAEKQYGAMPSGTPEEALWKQNVLLSELALQLAAMNETLTRIATAIEMLEGR